MGEHFVMSTRLDKCEASDFGLEQLDAKRATNPKDHTLWGKCKLEVFGWGKVIGFYKEPLPGFDTLLELVLYGKNRDDRYGAAAVILKKYPEKLLNECESCMEDVANSSAFKKLADIFNLKDPINLCPAANKSHDRIKSEYLRWKKISEAASRLK